MTSVERTFGGPSDNGARMHARLFDFGGANRRCTRQSRVRGALQTQAPPRRRRRKPNAASTGITIWKDDFGHRKEYLSV